MFVCCWRGCNEDVAVGGRFGAAYLVPRRLQTSHPTAFQSAVAAKTFFKDEPRVHRCSNTLKLTVLARLSRGVPLDDVTMLSSSSRCFGPRAKQLRFGKDLLDVTTSPNVPGHSEG